MNLSNKNLEESKKLMRDQPSQKIEQCSCNEFVLILANDAKP